MSRALPLVLDTDIGTDVDDALALGLLLASPEVELRAVTVVSGDVQLRGRIAKKLLMLAGQPHVPVAAGVREPVLRQRNFLWLGHEGRGIVEPDDRLELTDGHAVDVLIDTVLRERPQVLAIGPLSNLAVAIMKEPAVIGAIQRLTIMGGALGRGAGPLLEYNLASDAEAALVVLSAGIPTTLVPLDVTGRVFFTHSDLSALRRMRSRCVQILCAAMDVWAPLQRMLLESTSTFNADIVAFLHDPLAAAALVERSLMKTEALRLRPAIIDGAFQLEEDRAASPVDVVVDVDARRFADFVIQRLQRLP